MSTFHCNIPSTGDAKPFSSKAVAAQHHLNLARQPLLNRLLVVVHPTDALFTNRTLVASNTQSLPRLLRQRALPAAHYTCICLPTGKVQTDSLRLLTVRAAADFSSKAVINEQQLAGDPVIMRSHLCILTHAATPA